MKTNLFNKYTFETPLGACTLYWDENRLRGTSLDIDKRKNDPTPLWISEIAKRINNHLLGNPDNFLDIHLHFEKLTPFQKKVFTIVRQIPSGQVLTYKEIAIKAKSPLACRAIGQIMSRNPFPFIIPCHRVIGTNTLGGFSLKGGSKTKELMLQREGYIYFTPQSKLCHNRQKVMPKNK